MRDLSIEFMRFRCKNPFFLAASPVARTGDMICRAYQAGWGGAVTKSISLDQDLPDHGLSPRFVGVRSGGADLTGRICVIGSKMNEAALDKLFAK